MTQLNEVLHSIEHHAQQYLNTVETDVSVGETHLERLLLNVQQIERKLCDEFSVASAVVNGVKNIGLSSFGRGEVRYAIERLKRLHEKLVLFTYERLSTIAQDDSGLRRILLYYNNKSSLLSIVQQRRRDFINLLDRLESGKQVCSSYF